MKVYIRKVYRGGDVIYAVSEGGHFIAKAKEDGYLVTIGIKAVFIGDSDMKKADESNCRVRLERYGD
jgi:hypothetical protein